MIWNAFGSQKNNKGVFFFKYHFFGSLSIHYSFTLFHVAKAFYYETFREKKKNKKKYTTSLKYIARILISRFLLQQ